MSDERSAPLWPSLVVAAAAFVLFALVRQDRYDKDSLVFLKWFAEGRLDYYHPLYLPLATGFAKVLMAFGVDGPSALRLYSCFCGGVAVFFVHRIAGAASRSRGYAAFASAVFAVSPAVLFYSTQPELNMGAVALVAGSVFAAGRAARSAAGAGIAAALLFGLACAHHTVNALCWPGLVLLFALAQERYSLRRTAVFAACSAAGVVLLSLVLPRAVFWWFGKPLGSEAGTTLVAEIFANARWGAAVVYVLDQFVFFAGWILPLGLAGAAATPRKRLRVLAVVLTALPASIVFGVWDRADTGAYFLPQYPFLVWYGAGILHRVRDKRLVGTLLVITQAALGFGFLWTHDRVDHERLWREGLAQTIVEKGVPRDRVVALVFGFQRSLDLDLFAPGTAHIEVTFWRDEAARDWGLVKERLERDLLPDVRSGGHYLLDAEAIRQESGVRAPGLGWIAPNTAPDVVLEGTKILEWFRERFELVLVEKPGFKAYWLEPRS